MEKNEMIEKLNNKKLSQCDILLSELDQYLKASNRLKRVTESISQDKDLYSNWLSQIDIDWTDFQTVAVPKLVLRDLFKAQIQVETWERSIRNINQEIYEMEKNEQGL